MKEVKEFIENLPENYDKEKILSVYEESSSKEENITFENSYKLFGNILSNLQKYYELIFEALCKLGTEEVTFDRPIMSFMHCFDGHYQFIIKKIKFQKPVIAWVDRLDFYLVLVCDIVNSKTKNEIVKENYELSLYDLNDNCSTLSDILDYLSDLLYDKNLDSSYPKTMTVVNKDIIITDPCYIRKYDKEELNREYVYLNLDKENFDLIKLNGWDKKNLTMQQILDAYNKEKIYRKLVFLQNNINRSKDSEDWSESEFIKNYITSSTIYGDWSCTTFDTDTNEPIGEFCADAGEVGVFVLDEVLKYNPEFDYHINRQWTTTLIKNFTGEISIVKRHNEGVYEDETEWHKKGEKWEEDSIHVVGKGNINFETSQTGF